MRPAVPRVLTGSIDCLNRLMDGLILSGGPTGVRLWLIEIQMFIRLIQRRVLQGLPL